MRLPLLAALLATMANFSAHATTVRIHYDAGNSGMAVRADKGPATWSKGIPATLGADKVWTYTWPDKLGAVTMKPALGDHKVSIGGTYTLAAGTTLDIYPFFGPPFGKVTIVPEFASPQLNNSRKLRIYLPPSYGENAAKRYPVLYMHDGQNLFDAKAAAYGVEWGIDETINRLVATGRMEEVIVVGIDNTPERIAEYTPCCDPKYAGGKIDAYQAFLTDTLKPYIDKTYRTLPDKEHTAIMGSSLGGIASMRIAQRRPDLFAHAGALSSSFWWNNKDMVNKPAARVPVKFYIDAGGKEDSMDDTAQVREAMLRQGYREGADLLYFSDPAGIHNEKSWAARVEKPLAWFFAWGSAPQ